MRICDLRNLFGDRPPLLESYLNREKQIYCTSTYWTHCVIKLPRQQENTETPIIIRKILKLLFKILFEDDEKTERCTIRKKGLVCMKKTPRRRITVTSSINEISTDQKWNVVVRGVGTTPPTPPFSTSRFLDRYIKTTWTFFPQPSDITWFYVC
jgi:hypothetical protein